jgi:DNA-directed RNA polymerase specialized sigma24 family protein
VESPGRGVPEQSDDVIAAELVRRMKVGDAEAFVDLYDLYGSPLYSYLYLVLTDTYGAAQAAQDVFELGFDVLPEHSAVPIRVWLFWLAHRRAGGTRGHLRSVAPDDVDPLVSLVIRLPPGVREAVALRHVFGFSLPEAGVVLERSPRAISALERRGLDTLDRLLPSSDGAQPLPPERIAFRIRRRESPVAWGRRLALASR